MKYQPFQFSCKFSSGIDGPTHIGERYESTGIHLHSLGVQGHLGINELINQLVLNLSILVRDTPPHFSVTASTATVQQSDHAHAPLIFFIRACTGKFNGTLNGFIVSRASATYISMYSVHV